MASRNAVDVGKQWFQLVDQMVNGIYSDRGGTKSIYSLVGTAALRIAWKNSYDANISSIAAIETPYLRSLYDTEQSALSRFESSRCGDLHRIQDKDAGAVYATAMKAVDDDDVSSTASSAAAVQTTPGAATAIGCALKLWFSEDRPSDFLDSDLVRILGQGTYGVVGTIRTHGHHHEHFGNVKTFRTTNDQLIAAKFPLPGADAIQQQHEAYVGLMFINKLRSLIPSFVWTYGAVQCQSPTVVVSPGGGTSWCSNGVSSSDGGGLVIFTEPVTPGTQFWKLIVDACSNAATWSSGLVKMLGFLSQIVCALGVASRKFGLVHYDMHLKNVLIRQLMPAAAWIAFPVASDSDKIYVRSGDQGEIAMLIDYGFTTITAAGGGGLTGLMKFGRVPTKHASSRNDVLTVIVTFIEAVVAGLWKSTMPKPKILLIRNELIRMLLLPAYAPTSRIDDPAIQLMNVDQIVHDVFDHPAVDEGPHWDPPFPRNYPKFDHVFFVTNVIATAIRFYGGGGGDEGVIKNRVARGDVILDMSQSATPSVRSATEKATFQMLTHIDINRFLDQKHREIVIPPLTTPTEIAATVLAYVDHFHPQSRVQRKARRNVFFALWNQIDFAKVGNALDRWFAEYSQTYSSPTIQQALRNAHRVFVLLQKGTTDNENTTIQYLTHVINFHKKFISAWVDYKILEWILLGTVNDEGVVDANVFQLLAATASTTTNPIKTFFEKPEKLNLFHQQTIVQQLLVPTLQVIARSGSSETMKTVASSIDFANVNAHLKQYADKIATSKLHELFLAFAAARRR